MSKIETFQDPNGYWGILIDNLMDCDIPWAITEQGAEHQGNLNYPDEKIITTEDPEHYSNNR